MGLRREGHQVLFRGLVAFSYFYLTNGEEQMDTKHKKIVVSAITTFAAAASHDDDGLADECLGCWSDQITDTIQTEHPDIPVETIQAGLIAELGEHAYKNHEPQTRSRRLAAKALLRRWNK